MADWVFRAYDLTSGAYVGDLPIGEWTHEDKLNESGSWSARINPSPTAALTSSVQAAVLDGRALIVPWRDGQPLGYTGFIPPGGRRRGGITTEIAGGSILQALDYQLIETNPSLVFNGQDQFTMAATLVDIARGQHGPNIDTSQVGTSGVPRIQTWYRWEGKVIGEALRQKSALIDGFDFDIRTELDAGAVVRRLRCWYPRRGRVYAAQASPDFVVGGNVIDVPVVSGASEFVTHVVAIGKEIEGDPTRARRVATAVSPLVAQGWPIITERLDLNDVESDAVLQQHADGYIARYGLTATEDIAVTLDLDDPTHRWGTWDLGDDCRLIIPGGLYPNWPTGMVGIRRIIAHRWHYADGAESLQLVTRGTIDVDADAGLIVVVTPPPPPPVTPPPPPTPPVVVDPLVIDPVTTGKVPGYVDFPGTTGNYLSVPDETAFDDPGDRTYVWTMAATSLTPTAAQTIFAHNNSSTGQRSWRVRIEPSGQLTLRWSPDGTNSISASTSLGLAAMGITAGAFYTYAITHDVDNGSGGNITRFFFWDTTTHLWQMVYSFTYGSTTTSYFNANTGLYIGGTDAGTAEMFAGQVRSVSLRNGIGSSGEPGGTLVFAYQSSNIPADTASSFTAQTGQTITVNRSGTPDTLLVPESDPVAGSTYGSGPYTEGPYA